ncbi:MAG: glucosamine-6-phosphate deaminase [Victivallales bacterium]
MEIKTYRNSNNLGRYAAWKVAGLIKDAISRQGVANIILSAGASQYEMLSELAESDIDWQKVTVFHIDEYVGIPSDHPSSFRRFLKSYFESKVALRKIHYINGDAFNPKHECCRLNKIISRVEIDVACLGIGENGHIGFNEPPADFETDKPFIMVDVDEDFRKQQLGEDWFKNIDDVPRQAITMSIRQIIKSKVIVCTVPDERKALAVKDVVEGELTELVPASILKKHRNCWMFLDEESSSLLQSPVDGRQSSEENEEFTTKGRKDN